MPESTRPDPFDGLRLPTAPIAPRPAFASDLRRRLETALSPTDPDPEVIVSSTEPTTTAASALVPYLSVAGAAAAIDFYREAFGAIETTRFVGDDGRVGHAELIIGTAKVMLADEFPEMDVLGPIARGGTTVTLHLEVVDVDFTHREAVRAGATSQREPSDQGHGNRNATIVDPFGHRWMLSQPIAADRAASAEVDQGVGDGQAWTVTGRQPVEPGYLTFATGDLGRARAFYGELFDWEIEDGSQAGGGHIANTRFPMGFMQQSGDRGDESVITVYFRVDDIESYAQRVEALGGQILSRDDYPSGGNARCVDDQGARFDLFRPNPGY